jgi:hypothetical protein
MISMNINYLKEISFTKTTLEKRVVCDLVQCPNLKKLQFSQCSFPTDFDLALILQNLPHLLELALDGIPFSRQIAEIITRHCRLLKYLQLSSLIGIGDDELSILVEGCSSLRSLRLEYLLNITEESVKMLRNHRPLIPSIGFSTCQGVRLESVLPLLQECTLPAILDRGDEELQLYALEDLTQAIPLIEHPQISSLLSHESFLEGLVPLLALKNEVRWTLIFFFWHLTQSGYHHLVVDAGVASALIQHCNSFDEQEIELLLPLFDVLSAYPDYQNHLLTSGILSIFRLHRLQLLREVSECLLSSPRS